MSSTTRPQFRFFFAHNLKKYIDKQLYHLQDSERLFDILASCGSGEVQHWEKLPIGYLNHKESLGLALARAFNKSGSRIHHDDSFREILRLFEKYFEEESGEKREARSFAFLSLGVIFLERALFENVERQRKFLRVAAHYLEEGEQAGGKVSDQSMKAKLLEVTYLYRTLVEVCLAELPNGIKYLSRAAKITSNPEPLWKMLASIYHHLGMINVSQFYRQKATGLSPKSDSQNQSPRRGQDDGSQMVA